MKIAPRLVAVVMIAAMGCAAEQLASVQRYAPKSILVLPPLNETTEVNAPYELLSSITRPLAAKGYYVYPVAVVDRYMKENGLPTPGEMHAVPLSKINEIIGADAVLYATVKRWSKPNLATGLLAALAGVSPYSEVTVNYRFVDVRTGDAIWDMTRTVKRRGRLRDLGTLCNRDVAKMWLPPGPRHPAYKGPEVESYGAPPAPSE